MDDNNHGHDGFLHHILDPQLGQTVLNIVRGILPHNEHPAQGGESQQSSTEAHSSSSSPLSPAAPAVTMSETSSHTAGSSTAPIIPIAPSSSSNQHTTPSATTPGLPSYAEVASTSSLSDPQVHDVEMTSAPDASLSSTPELSRPPSAQARNTRRARVDDDDEDEDWRESNRQRMHSFTSGDDEHRYMPIPENHGVPPPQEDRVPPQRNEDPNPGQPRNDLPPPPPYSRMMWTFEFAPFGPRRGQAGPQDRQDAPAAPEPQAQAQPQAQAHPQDVPPMMNFFLNIPIPGGPAPQPGAAPNLAHEGGPIPGFPGFTFHPFPFPFPFGMDMTEEKDDPERAQRLVDGLEEVPAGLIKRMEVAGGPGTGQGEVPTCAVCFEGLLDPEGGGFEGNAELAKAEAAAAARDDAASQQGRETSMDVDGAASAPSPSPSEQSSTTASSSSTAPESSGDNQSPKIVVLPCSHAFHATCLLPWFSKPGRTTCPSCRFDIDPDSLTYRPRPLRARPQPEAAAQDGAAPQPQPQQQPQAAPVLPPLNIPFDLPQFFPVPPPAAQTTQDADNNPNVDGAPTANAGEARGARGQQGHPPLPPFITFDMRIYPILPGRNGEAAPQPPSTAGAGQNPAGAPVFGPPPPPPPRADHNGFRFDNTLLQDAVQTTFERLLGVPLPPFTNQAGPGPAPGGNDGPQWFAFTGPLPAGVPPMPVPPVNPHAPRGGSQQRPGPRRPKRQWAPPPPPGPTLRQVVERNERAMGLRCSDVSCGVGPSDDDPVSSIDLSTLPQISIRPLKSDTSGRETVCEHKFHPACLVSAERVAGWGHEVKTGEPAGDDEDVEVSCPVCRALGVISRTEWEDGACALA